ncbi:hypothetical protein V8C37DRAFT_379101 [Trichoderma ceciliae]
MRRHMGWPMNFSPYVAVHAALLVSWAITTSIFTASTIEVMCPQLATPVLLITGIFLVSVHTTTTVAAWNLWKEMPPVNHVLGYCDFGQGNTATWW